MQCNLCMSMNIPKSCMTFFKIRTTSNFLVTLYLCRYCCRDTMLFALGVLILDNDQYFSDQECK